MPLDFHLCCWISSFSSLLTWILPIVIPPALLVVFVISIYAISTAKHPPKIEVYKSEKTFQDPNNEGKIGSYVICERDIALLGKTCKSISS